MAEASSQDRAGGAEQDVRGRDQALHNPSAQGQGPDLIASRRRRGRRRGQRRRRRRRLRRRRRRGPVAVRVNAVAVGPAVASNDCYDKIRYKIIYRRDGIVMNEEKKNALIVFVITYFCFYLRLSVSSDINIIM